MSYISCLHSLLLLPAEGSFGQVSRIEWDCGARFNRKDRAQLGGARSEWGTAAASNQKHPQQSPPATAESLYLNATINMNNVQINGMMYDVTFRLRFMLYMPGAIHLFARSVHSQAHA